MEHKSNSESNNEDIKPSGFKVIKVLLLQSSFVREKEINLNDLKGISHHVDFKPVAYTTASDNQFAVTLDLNYKGMREQLQICASDISMIGVFEKYGEPKLSEDRFKAVNAPAIIYPFIREHLYNLCLRAGIADVLLPTVNFAP